MPLAPPKVCAHPSCGATTRAARCDEHRRAKERQRGTAHERDYGARHRRVRTTYLASHPLCERCREDGRVHRAKVLHHIDEDPRNNDPSNLEALCRDHHEIHHDRMREERAWWNA